MIPHVQPAAWPDAPPSRFAAHVHAVPAGCRVALLGLPDDTGVKLNGGRPGARAGPSAFRDALARYGAAEPAGAAYPRVFDAGDIIPAEDIHETHRRVTEASGALLDMNLLPVAVGGGHDLTFPFVRAAAERFRPLSGVYFDAHLDVRETVGSGMPFRKLLEECGVGSLEIHGYRPLVNAREHVEWFRSHGGRIVEEPGVGGGTPAISTRLPHCFVSFDMDVLDAAHAPGVSALNPAGWSVARAESWVAAAGRAGNVRCFDIMELNPAHDDQGRTARVAAHLFLTFLRGVAERGEA